MANNTLATVRRYAALEAALQPVHDYLENDAVIEIMLNADGRVWVDMAGEGLVQSNVVMGSDEAERVIRLCASAMNTEVNERQPSLAAKLPVWGYRVQAAVPPIVEAPVFAFRKPSKRVFSLEDYVASDILSSKHADIIVSAVQERRNILIGGGAGSGKTTLANSILQCVAATHDRLYIIEDNPELQCTAANKVQIFVQSGYTFQNAVMDALRFRPDRIIVGEVRDGAALDLLKTWNTGHPGGLATIHANDPRAMLERLGQLIEEVIPQAPRYLIAEAVDLCIHISRDVHAPAGRIVNAIAQVNGLTESGAWDMKFL
ncbi:MAG: P-type conjugative transfer ATPase TrbB [Desulfobulbaceae bacterium]|nr:P-type conjugative transfer ATPase TrbB [Desulfobulbaceae bacterium]